MARRKHQNQVSANTWRMFLMRNCQSRLTSPPYHLWHWAQARIWHWSFPGSQRSRTWACFKHLCNLFFSTCSSCKRQSWGRHDTEGQYSRIPWTMYFIIVWNRYRSIPFVFGNSASRILWYWSQRQDSVCWGRGRWGKNGQQRWQSWEVRRRRSRWNSLCTCNIRNSWCTRNTKIW